MKAGIKRIEATLHDLGTRDTAGADELASSPHESFSFRIGVGAGEADSDGSESEDKQT